MHISVTQQFNSLFGLKLFPKNTIQIHTYKHKKWRAQVQRIWTQLQFNGTTKSLSHKSTFHNLAPLIREEKTYSLHTELINTSISYLWNWGIYQWSARIFNKEHKSKPFPFSFSSVVAEFLLLTNFLFRPIGVLLKIALKAKSWTIALLLDIKESKNIAFFDGLINNFGNFKNSPGRGTIFVQIKHCVMPNTTQLQDFDKIALLWWVYWLLHWTRGKCYNFAEDILKSVFLIKNCCILIRVSPPFLHKYPISNKSLFQGMPLGDRPLSKRMVA